MTYLLTYLLTINELYFVKFGSSIIFNDSQQNISTWSVDWNWDDWGRVYLEMRFLEMGNGFELV